MFWWIVLVVVVVLGALTWWSSKRGRAVNHAGAERARRIDGGRGDQYRGGGDAGVS